MSILPPRHRSQSVRLAVPYELSVASVKMDEAGKMILGVIYKKNDKTGDGSNSKDENFMIEAFNKAD